MKHLLLLFFAVSALVSPCRADITKLAPQDRQHLLYDTFAIVTRVKSLPPLVKKEFARISRAPDFQMADPGQKYQETEVIQERGLPFRRLAFAGLSHDYCFVYYELGGYSHSVNVVLFRVSKGKAQFIWGGAGGGRFSNWKGLRAGIKRRQFDDELSFSW